MSPVIRFVGDKSSVARLHESRVPMPELVGNDLKAVPIAECLNSVGVSPIVESSAREFYRGRCLQMLVQCAELANGEQGCGVSELLGVLGEDLPRPELGSADDPVTPRGLPSSGVDGTRLEINIAPHQAFDNLPLDARSGHQRLDRSVGHGQRTYERFRLHTVKPARGYGVRCGSLDIAHDVRFDHVLPTEPLPEGRESSVVSVLRGAATGELRIQEESDARLRELSSRERDAFGDHASNLSLVLLTSGRPLGDERIQVGRRLSAKELIECARFEGIVGVPELRAVIEDERKWRELSVMTKSLHHPLDIFRDFFASGPTGKDPRPSISKRDASLPPKRILRSVRHGPKSSPFATPFATSTLETGLTPCA